MGRHDLAVALTSLRHIATLKTSFDFLLAPCCMHSHPDSILDSTGYHFFAFKLETCDV